MFVVKNLADAAPAVLIQPALISKLLDFSLRTMRSAIEEMGLPGVGAAFGTRRGSEDYTFPLYPSGVAAASARSKRKYLESIPSCGIVSVSCGSPTRLVGSDMFRSACQIITCLTELAPQMLQANEVAATCEQLVHVLWVGLVATLRPGFSATTKSVVAYAEKSAASCRRLCQDAKAVSAALDLLEALHRQRCGGGSASLVSGISAASVALLEGVIACTTTARCYYTGDEPLNQMDSLVLIRRRALQVRESLIRSHTEHQLDETCIVGDGVVLGSQPVVIIQWPAPSVTTSVACATSHDVVVAQIVTDSDSQLCEDTQEASGISCFERPCGLDEGLSGAQTSHADVSAMRTKSSVRTCFSTPKESFVPNVSDSAYAPQVGEAAVAESEVAQAVPAVGVTDGFSRRSSGNVVIASSALHSPGPYSGLSGFAEVRKVSNEPLVSSLKLEQKEPDSGHVLELFADDDRSECPDLCMDSPSSDENRLDDVV